MAKNFRQVLYCGLVFLMLVLLFVGCGQSSVPAPVSATRNSESTTQIPASGSTIQAPASVDTAQFVALFKNSGCADIRNRLFLIDNSLVLSDRVGNCPDAGYELTLYDGSPNSRIEDVTDSIAGPMWLVSTPDYLQMFQTIQANLDKADLGLGSGHTVLQIPLQ